MHKIQRVFFRTWTPSPVRAEQDWICHMRSRIVCRFRPSAISEAGAAVSKSCLFAKIRTGTPLSFSSSSNSASSCEGKKTNKKTPPNNKKKPTQTCYCFYYPLPFLKMKSLLLGIPNSLTVYPSDRHNIFCDFLIHTTPQHTRIKSMYRVEFSTKYI